MTQTSQDARIAELMKLGLAHHEAGRIQRAAEVYQQILALAAGHAGALHYAGLAAHQQGQHETAIALMTRAIEREPASATYHLNLGQVLETSDGQHDRAIDCYRQAIALDPGLEPAHSKLGLALLKKGDAAGAVASFSQVLKIKPDSYQTINSLGDALQKLGQPEQAIVCYRKAIALNPSYVAAHNNMGTVLEHLSRFDEAIAAYTQALALRPAAAEIASNLGGALRSRGKLEEAVEACQKAIALRPDFSPAHVNLANARKDQGLLREAVASYRKAISLSPSDPLTHTNLANVLVMQDKIDEAIESYRAAINLELVKGTGYTNLLYLYSSTCYLAPSEERTFAEGWEKRMLTESQREAARARASVHSGAWPTQSRRGRKLRLGIVSAELGEHAVAVFLQPFLDHLDRGRIHLTLFPTVGWSDARAQHFRQLADHYVPLIGVPDEIAAERVRAEQIDVLIDTTGHTSNCRLGIFAHRVAPVQCEYIGYWSTTGLTEIDWYITDNGYAGHCESHFTEKLWKLPHQAHCYRGDEGLPESTWQPDRDGTVWLGSFNKYLKMRDATLRLWAKVLNAIPNTKLLLEDRAPDETQTHDRIVATITSLGVDANRVVFLPRVPGAKFPEHMALYNRLDIALDTIPFNSGTTAFDALWMGVPIVALEGNRVCGRMASSIVTALGHPEWSAKSEDEYVAIVRTLANDVEGRKQLRKTQRAVMRRSSLCDGRQLARSLEDALEAMYDRWTA
jgi:predicted O-linked N-acetylglucosamine transferase (SPINDLY family)